MAKTKGKLRKNLHSFWFNFRDGSKPLQHKAPVRRGVKSIEIVLTAEDAQRAIRAKGAGNSMLCAGAQCLQRYADAFPHPVFGPADWLDTTVFIPDKVDRSGLPRSCVQYTHTDNIAKLFDRSPRGLLKMLKEDGPITITLKPPTVTKTHKPPEGFVRRFTGERSGQIHDGRGARHRQARVFAGLGQPTIR